MPHPRVRPLPPHAPGLHQAPPGRQEAKEPAAGEERPRDILVPPLGLHRHAALIPICYRNKVLITGNLIRLAIGSNLAQQCAGWHLVFAVRHHIGYRSPPSRNSDYADPGFNILTLLDGEIMSETVNWLHLTDLHLGLDKNNWHWPRTKHLIFDDIKALGQDIGPWDLVFFTGDLVQKGSADEYKKLDELFSELWAVFAKGGSKPALIAVPGNHDLVRPDPTDPTLIALKHWGTEAGIQKAFWTDANSPYRKLVASSFENYVNWLNSTTTPILPHAKGLLPGDFSATFEKGEFRLGIIGVNSTFLQLAEGDFNGKLSTHVAQLQAVCDGDPDKWLRERHGTTFLMHQPPEWLSTAELAHFKGDVFPSGRFISLLCGHQHASKSTDLGEGGGAPRRIRQGASLFGLDTWVTPTLEQKTRIHGYAAGQYIFESNRGIEKLWPRLASPSYDGGFNIDRDTGYKLQRDGSTTTEFDYSNEPTQPEDTEYASDPIETSTATDVNDLKLLDDPPGADESKERLARCPRIAIGALPQHSAVRQESQQHFRDYLQQNRHAWIVADWGVGDTGFISASLEQLNTEDVPVEAFHLRCEDIEYPELLDSLFVQQFGMSLSVFLNAARTLPNVCLVFDGIHPELASGKKLAGLKQKIKVILDYCQELRLVFVCRLQPDDTSIPSLVLYPLDVLDTRTYLMHHPDASSQLIDADTVEKLYAESEGLPMHLDRMLKALRVSSLASVLQAEQELAAGVDPTSPNIPKALRHAVASLIKSKDARSERSLRLLKALSVLPHGETIETLKHFLPAEPFFPEHAAELNELALLHVIPIQDVARRVGPGKDATPDAVTPKILRVPRQVRDYVFSFLTREEHEEFVLAGANRFFGPKWRQGTVRFRGSDRLFGEHAGRGAGNEWYLIYHMFLLGREKGREFRMADAIALAVQYCNELAARHRYRDVILVAGNLVATIDRVDEPMAWARSASLLGRGLRMLGKHEESLKCMEEALEVGNGVLADTECAMIWLNIALLHERVGDSAATIDAAKRAQGLSSRTSGVHLHATTIIAQAELSGPALEKRLAAIEKRARSSAFVSIADNIALDRARAARDYAEKMDSLKRVLENQQRGYNQVRAIVDRVEAILEEKSPWAVSDADLRSLASAYSYLHGQRFGTLFDRCHRALWQCLEAQGKTELLLRLFLHSSFLWRIRGEEEKEAEYVRKLDKQKAIQAAESAPKIVVIEVRYFKQRLSALVSALIGFAKPGSDETGEARRE